MIQVDAPVPVMEYWMTPWIHLPRVALALLLLLFLVLISFARVL
jgi:hypothetical protein